MCICSIEITYCFEIQMSGFLCIYKPDLEDISIIREIFHNKRSQSRRQQRHSANMGYCIE